MFLLCISENLGSLLYCLQEKIERPPFRKDYIHYLQPTCTFKCTEYKGKIEEDIFSEGYIYLIQPIYIRGQIGTHQRFCLQLKCEMHNIKSLACADLYPNVDRLFRMYIAL